MALNLACDSRGSGPPLLVLHGLFGSGSHWRGVARELAESHTVHCVDLRNHGGSPWADSMDYAEMADDVLLLMDHLGLREAALMGHSMGGKTAMALALRQPQRVSRLVVVDIAPLSYVDADAPSPPAAALTMSREHFDWRVNMIGVGAAMHPLCGFPDELRSARFDGPVTAIAGQRSAYVARHDGAGFRPMFPRAGVQVLADAGHWPHIDQPAAFVACLRRALQAPAGRAARPSSRPDIQETRP
jgi:esterase